MISVRPNKDIVIAGGLRTPFARAGGAFRREDAGHLGARITREVLDRAGLDPTEVDQLICGCVGQPFNQANVARVVALRAGLPEQTPAVTVARNCASGIEAVTQAVTALEAGHGSLFLCVGVEVMSAYPLVFSQRATDRFGRLARARSLPARLSTLAGFRPKDFAPRIALVEGLTDPTCGLIMGKTAEILAREFDVTREQADAYALESHRRAGVATEAGRFEAEILPHLPLASRPGARSLDRDDGVRADQTLARLAKLRPYFEKPDGVVTVGNSCGVTDGATAMFVTTAERARELGLEVHARIRSFAWAGLSPRRMGLGPVYASAGALDAAGCTLADMDTVELNEAFATQVLACKRAFASADFARSELGRDAALGQIDPARLNPNGGAIALGHPVGATGGRLLLTAARELAAGDGNLALATLCIGGGQGGAVVLERRAA
jgi:acetyl-CoA C-acetyltransferase